MPELWTKKKEIEFFKEAQKFATPEQLFYLGDDSRYYAYWPKSYQGEKATLQSRNSLIGNFTERYSVDLLQELASSKGCFAVQGVVCDEIGLTSRSPADLAICKTKSIEQSANDILTIIEVKMSIVWNWELQNNELICLGDYKSHKGNPGLLRSDSMLKAIGKSAIIRATSFSSSQIPIIVLGNTPIANSYISKVDHLKKVGFIQGFWSVNPNPLDNDEDKLNFSPGRGFIRMNSYADLKQNFEMLFSEQQDFFSSMKSRKELAKIIEIANRESNLEKKAEKFLSLLRA